MNITLNPLFNSYYIYFPFFIQIADLPMIRILCGINSASWPDLRHWFPYSGLSIPLKSLLSSLSSLIPQPPSGSTVTPGLLKLRSLYFVAKQPLTKQYFPGISMHLFFLSLENTDIQKEKSLCERNWNIELLPLFI